MPEESEEVTALIDILLVDDEEAVRKEGAANLVAQLKENGVEASVDAVATLGDGLDHLEKRTFHVAVVDLRLKDATAGGNEVIRQVVDARILPIIVYTGFKDELSPEFRNHGLIFVVGTKKMGEVGAKILEWHERRVLEFFSESGIVASTLHAALLETMWRHVSKYWEFLPPDQKQLDQIAARILATLVYDNFSSTAPLSGGIGEVAIHPGEIYIFATPRQYLAVGDVVNDKEKLFIVLTPACDLVLRKAGKASASVVLLAEFESLKEFAGRSKEFAETLGKLSSTSKEDRDEGAENVERMMRHAWLNDSGRRFFLPPFATFPGGMIDFLRLSTAPYGGEDSKRLVANRVLSLNREVASELAARFVRFMSRLGQAPFDTQELVRLVLKAAK